VISVNGCLDISSHPTLHAPNELNCFWFWFWFCLYSHTAFHLFPFSKSQQFMPRCSNIPYSYRTILTHAYTPQSLDLTLTGFPSRLTAIYSFFLSLHLCNCTCIPIFISSEYWLHHCAVLSIFVLFSTRIFCESEFARSHSIIIAYCFLFYRILCKDERDF